MDPEDLLTLEVPALAAVPNHIEENTRIIAELKELGISYRYTRFEGAGLSETVVQPFNSVMAKFQKIRLRPGVEMDGAGLVGEGSDDEDFAMMSSEEE
jgi:hypothetical protein